MLQDRFTVHHKSRRDQGDKPVVYWMQQSQRTIDNFALSYAIKHANQLKTSLTVLFIHDPLFKESNLRHHTFMLEGVLSLESTLHDLNIDFKILQGPLEETVVNVLDTAGVLYIDKSYLYPLRQVKKAVILAAQSKDITTIEVESDVIVPVAIASPKAEFGARTLRPKLHRALERYLEQPTLENVTVAPKERSLVPSIDGLLSCKEIDQTVPKSTCYKGGQEEALTFLARFLEERLPLYPLSNDPSLERTSQLSPYLHFGHISPLTLYHHVMIYIDDYSEAVEGFIEQLLVRRELAYNYVYYTNGYDAFKTMTEPWAYQTMAVHQDDVRPYNYTIEDYLSFRTHDVYFNAAMKEMVKTGFMHNYMRMYWGKKIIEWSPSHQAAYQTILSLNNTYFIDGRDPSSYASVAWLFGKHDRPYGDRDIFGKLRYMNANGLKRKFNIDAYIKRIERL